MFTKIVRTFIRETESFLLAVRCDIESCTISKKDLYLALKMWPRRFSSMKPNYVWSAGYWNKKDFNKQTFSFFFQSFFLFILWTIWTSSSARQFLNLNKIGRRFHWFTFDGQSWVSYLSSDTGTTRLLLRLLRVDRSWSWFSLNVLMHFRWVLSQNLTVLPDDNNLKRFSLPKNETERMRLEYI